MSGKGDVGTWLRDNLSQLLSFPVPQDLIEYIMTIENERDIDDYLRTLLDFNIPSHKQFCDNYKVIRHFKEEKKESTENMFQLNTARANKQDKMSKGNSKDLAPLLEQMTLTEDKPSGSGVEGGKKKKKEKYVNLYSPEGAGRDVVMLKGRHHCDCQAFKHRLVNNCLSCGRIVCAQEGSGPCLFCGSLVCSKEEQEFINAKTSQSQKLYDNLMDTGRPEGWEMALAQRDRLLEYDRTTQRRTRVIDDEGEYFSVGSVWLSPTERDKLAQKEEKEREKRHASRLNAKFTLDFAGRHVVEEDDADMNEPSDADDWINATNSHSSTVHPDVTLEWQPEFVPSGQHKEGSGGGKTNGGNGMKLVRVQDRELLEMADTGACLSMHQPWASLLVHGIKRHEGRTWYSAHRGRLWIAAGSKPPADADIKETEHYYRLLTNEKLVFPQHYPVSCLLGCVTVIDCLSQEEYQARYHHRESDSPFVLICEDPQPLSLKFPISGKHKIYKLDNLIHLAAQKALLRKAKKETTAA